MESFKNPHLIKANQFFCLLLSWFGLAGLAIYIVGLYGRLNPLNTVIIFLFPLVMLIFYLYFLVRRLFKFTLSQKLISFFILCQLVVYSLGLFIPETGFDALWYHLPEALHYSQTGRVTAIPGLFYSTMPRLGEMFYTAAFFTHSLIFIKSVAFIFALCLILGSYFLSRVFLSRSQSLLAALTVNSLYLVAWQSSSAYVDLPRAVFELGALICLILAIKNRPIHYSLYCLSAVLMGFALSIKIQSFVGLFSLTAFLFLCLRFLKFKISVIILYSLFFMLISLFVAAPWYLDNYLSSGHPLYPANTLQIRQNILSHVGASSETDWLIHRIIKIPLIFWDLGTLSVYQLSPIIIILFPVLLWRLKFIVSKPMSFFLLLFSLISIVLWWFIPPAESRYLLPALPPLIILLFYSVFSLSPKYTLIKQLAIFFIFTSLILNFFLRAASSLKYLPVIFGSQTPQAYLNTQTTSFNLLVVSKFYSTFWPDYSYPKE